MNFKPIGNKINRGLAFVIYADPGCLSGDSFINYKIGKKGTKWSSSKGGTLERLYQRFHKINVGGQGLYQRPKTLGMDFYVPSVDSSMKIVLNKVIDVVDSGVKELFLIKTLSGKKLKATSDHKILTENGYRELSDILPGDRIFIHTNKIPSKGRDPRPYKKEVAVKYHPKWSKKVLEGKYIFYRTHESRAVYEASMNGMNLNEYVDFLNTEPKIKINKLKFIPDGKEVHHLDENVNNNCVTNLVLVSPYEHYEFHKKNSVNRVAYYAHLDTVVSKDCIGKGRTYDLKVEDPYRNFIANGIVVHNCGKTTMATTLPEGETLIINLEAGLGPILGTKHIVFNLHEAEGNGLDKLDKLYQYLLTQKHPFKYVVVDNISELEQWIILTLTNERKKEFTELREYGDAAFKLREFLTLFRDLIYKGITVVFNAWEAPIEIKNFNGEIITKTFPKLSKKIAPEICGKVDIVGHLEVFEKTGQRWLRIGPSDQYITKSQFAGLDKGEPADFKVIIGKVMGFDYGEKTKAVSDPSKAPKSS